MKEDDILTSDLLYVWSQYSDEVYQKIHCHAEYEIYYFIQGDIEYRIEGRHYIMAPESLLLIPPNCFHGVIVKSTEPYRRIAVHFRPELLDDTERPLLLGLFQAERMYYPELSNSGIGFLVQSIADCKNLEESLRAIAIKHRSIALLTHICNIHSHKMTSSTPPDRRIQAVLRYVNGNLQRPITIEQLVDRFHISRNHLNILFRRETGTTIHHYILLKRLTLVRQEIWNGYGIEEAAYKAGFSDYSNFFRAYKTFFGDKPSAKYLDWDTVLKSDTATKKPEIIR
jgi:AraC-like DNA-binding protein